MTATNIEEPPVVSPAATWSTPAQHARLRPTARPAGTDWPATRQNRDTARAQLTLPPCAPDSSKSHPGCYQTAVGLLLDWLAEQPGRTWQERWRSSGADAGGRSWRDIPTTWLRDRGYPAEWQHNWFFRALSTAFGADLIRPSLPWLVTATFRQGSLVNALARCRDPEGFARLQTLSTADPDISPPVATRTTYRAAIILAAKGGTLTDITTGDVLELLDAEAAAHRGGVGAAHLFYRTLHAMGVFGPNAPATLRELRTSGQRTPEEMIDGYGITCGPIRDLLVDYLRERQPALDYTSLQSLAWFLGGLFWADLERHHPGIGSLDLPPVIADAWKQRLRTVVKTTRTPDGKTVPITVERINYRDCLTPVRAFYLDLAHWAVEDPARWAPWVAPCPIRTEETNRRKDKRHRKSRMDARTRERLPVLPVLVRSVDQRRKEAAALLDAARRTAPGQEFTTITGQTLIRSVPRRSAASKTWATDPGTGILRDLGREEEYAFWAFAAVEVLRATGIRIEELTELSHHSLVQYRLPTTGEVVPLLQVAPSKTDAERLLPID